MICSIRITRKDECHASIPHWKLGKGNDSVVFTFLNYTRRKKSNQSNRRPLNKKGKGEDIHLSDNPTKTDCSIEH